MRLLQAEADWVEASAKVIACEYKYASIVDVSLEDGVDHSKYQIIFNYYSHGEYYEGYFFQYESIEEGTLLPLFYNPSVPRENNLALYPEKKSRRLIKWLTALVIAALFIYLCEHFGIDPS